MPSRSCCVSFTDSEGIEHSVRVPAESLYEAALEAIAAFRRSVLAEMPLGPATRLTISEMAPEEEHTVTIAKVLSWLDGAATSPSEKLRKPARHFQSGVALGRAAAQHQFGVHHQSVAVLD